ncbi:thioesterase II family protein [Saccharothrix australiensis]|uniref:Surfactin synthase thioesterase subunit n=1 Tax=Saccharothrix australiensis TaxID=2072 RepID=A0A495VYJ4_9PSEU|nr:alpha/beta fold hydrolase [Saccharothrix australiensis]RKT54482.1 surfactin synthase thioesterase subunit [Saccharothrix australiensis]
MNTEWFRHFHDAPAGAPRLICFPHAGGAASAYLPLARVLSSFAEVWCVQYPARQERRREPHFGTVPALADMVAEALGEGPYAFFGHSMGAVVAYEVAHRVTPTALIVSGRRAPSTTRSERVHLRDDDGVLAEIRALSGTDQRILDNDELLRMVLPTLRADYRAVETYEFPGHPPLSTPITALVGDRDPKATVPEVEAWAGHTTGPFGLHVLPGGHFFLDDRRQEVAALVRAALTAAA